MTNFKDTNLLMLGMFNTYVIKNDEDEYSEIYGISANQIVNIFSNKDVYIITNNVPTSIIKNSNHQQ